jgi:hypothetical protein
LRVRRWDLSVKVVRIRSRVQGIVKGLGSRVEGLGLRVEGLELRVWGVGCRGLLGLGCRV